MTTKTKEKKVSDMTVEELKECIRETVLSIIDSDYGLELRPEIADELRESLKRKERGIPLCQVIKELDIE